MDDPKKFKIREAEYFYRQMEKTVDNREIFLFNFSAFTSAARSVLQYILEEAEVTSTKPWYDEQMVSDVLKFFRDLRDDNIHNLKPVNPPADITIHVGTGSISTKGGPSGPGQGGGGNYREILLYD